MEGKVPSQVFGAFNLSRAWEGRGLSLPAWRGFPGAGVSRDPKLRQCIPVSWKEATLKWGDSGCQGQVLWELSFWAFSLSPWETRATVCHMYHFWQGPPESPVFLALLAKVQSQRTSLLVLLSLPLHPRTLSLLSLCLECCSFWEPGSVPHACLRLLRATLAPGVYM